MIKAEVRGIEDVFTLRQHIAELEGLETPQGPAIKAAAGKNGKRSSLKQAREGIFISTRQGSVIDGNQFLLDMLGYTIEELFGMNVIDLCLSPADGAEFLKALDGKGYVIDYRTRLHKKDGSEFNCLLTSTIRWYNDDNIPDNQPLFKTWVRPAK
jgi:PAS domain S-box-containing protein